MNYLGSMLGGSSSSSTAPPDEIGNKVLRVRIGPSIHHLSPAHVNNQESPHYIDSPYFTGKILIRVKNFKGEIPEDAPENKTTEDYFTNHKRLFSIQVQGRFKHEYTSDDVVFGAEFERKLSPPTGAWVAIKFANLIDPALLTDLYSETPWLYSPILCSMNVVNVQPASESITSVVPAKQSRVSISSDDTSISVAGPDLSHPNSQKKDSKDLISFPTFNKSAPSGLGQWVPGEMPEDTTLLFSTSSPPFPSDSIHGRRKYFQSSKARKSLVFSPDNVYNMEKMTRVILNLRLNSPAIFRACRIFYESLGWKIFKDSSTSEILLVNYVLDVTLRLVCLDQEKEGGDLISPIELGSFTENLWAVFTVDSLSTISNLFDLNKHPYLSNNFPPQFNAAVELLTKDPAGNAIGFVSKRLVVMEKHLRSVSTKRGRSVLGRRSSTPKKRIGILTSGGDSSGMNAAVRSITRFALQKGCIPFAIFEGYQGLVDGGDKIKQFGWEDVRGMISTGGTSIGTARCSAFRTREGRLKAATNMINAGIDALIVIGGDGSLTGADTLRAEWQGLLDELVSKSTFTEDEVNHFRKDLAIVGLVGSIDNDMSATDLTIGAVTSLHRICEALDSLSSTASSHQRAFVVEVMGRHCGWLALMAGMASGADWVFLPERPPPMDTCRYGDDWESEMCETVQLYRKKGARKTMVIVCEGAIDRNLNPIKAETVKKVLEERLKLDTRVTTLGHVQRGGIPCAMDRLLASLQGIEAVKAVLRSTPDIPAPMIGTAEGKIIKVSLMEAVQLTHSVADAISKKDFARAMELRDPMFESSYDAFIETTLLTGPRVHKLPENERLRIGIIHVGAPAGGMNAATRVAARICLNRGHTALGIRNGFSGLLRDEVRVLNWEELIGWQARGGSELGTNRDHPRPLPTGPEIHNKYMTSELLDLGQVAYHLQKHEINALLVIGGFEGYTSIATLAHARSLYPAFCIPMVHIPATVSNNVPGTDFSIGSDTALNAIIEACDRIKLSANASRKRVFVVEVQGGTCGYLAAIGGLIAGATTAYVPEVGVSLSSLQRDIKHLVRRYNEDDRRNLPNEGRIILRTERTAPEIYSTDVISGILRAEGKGVFDSRTSVLGHLQQGGIPTPMDRIRATRLAVQCMDWIQQACSVSVLKDTKTINSKGNHAIYTVDPNHACVIGIRGGSISFSPVNGLELEADTKSRRSNSTWWLDVNNYTRMLAKYDYSEESDVEDEISTYST